MSNQKTNGTTSATLNTKTTNKKENNKWQV